MVSWAEPVGRLGQRVLVVGNQLVVAGAELLVGRLPVTPAERLVGLYPRLRHQGILACKWTGA
jgi:hypothetical protein